MTEAQAQFFRLLQLLSSGASQQPGTVPAGPASSAATLPSTDPALDPVCRLEWLVKLRWMAIAGLMIATWVASAVIGAIEQPVRLYAIAVGLAAANGLFTYANSLLRGRLRLIRRWAIAQGLTDLVAITLMIHYSGGVENPFVFFYIFHTVIGSIIFRPPICYLHTATACVLFGGLIGIEYFSPSAHIPLASVALPGLASSSTYVAGVFVSFCATLIITAHLTGRLVRELRRQGAERDHALLELHTQEKQLEHCTDQIGELIRRAEAEGSFDIRYENPHLRPCWVIKECGDHECPAYGAENLRCWQMARDYCHQLFAGADDFGGCPSCEVYQEARPDKLTEIGESFNNTMCFLERHAREASELQKQIMHQEKMAVIGQMAAGVAHEIGNPLASISSLVQYLSRKSTDAPLQESLALVNSHIERISRIVRDMVNFARPMAPEEEIIDVNATIMQAVKMARYDKRSLNVQIETQLSGQSPMTRASGDQLMQVFVNIISNALDATGDGGTLTISTAEFDNVVRVAFVDTGMGMTKDEMQHIFEPFFTTKEVGAGTGLGLSVTDSIVRKLGGRIEVDSRKGEGTRFDVYLPCASE